MTDTERTRLNTERRRLNKVWADAVMPKLTNFISKVKEMCELHFAAGRDFEREQDSKCRAALEKIGCMLGDKGDCYVYDTHVEVYRTTEIVDMIDKAIGKTAAKPPKSPGGSDEKPNSR